MKEPCRLRTAYLRLRHRRGHGIHSPFVYSLAREVFMGKHPLRDSELEEILRQQTFTPKRVAELARLYEYLGLEGFTATDSLPEHPLPHHLYILPGRIPPAGVPGLFPVVVCLRCRPRETHRIDALRIDRRGYTLYVFDPDVTNQHFIL